MAKLTLALGCLAAAVIAVGVAWASMADGLGGIVIVFWAAIPTAVIAIVGLVVAVRAGRVRAAPRWMTVTGVVLDVLALIPAVYFIVGFVAILIQFSTMNTYY